MARHVPESRARVRLALVATLVAAGLVGAAALATGLTDPRLAGVIGLVMLVALAIGIAELSSRRRELDRILTLYESLQRVTSSSDVQDVLGTVAREASLALSAKDCVVMYRRGADLVLYPSAGSDVKPTATPLGHLAFSDDPTKQLPSVRVILTGEALEIEDAEAFDGPPGFLEACRAVGIRAALVVPVTGGGSDAVASLNLGFATTREFSEADRRLAQAYADQASAALQRALAYEREREAAERVRELDQMKSDFLSTVSHELRAPLTGITGFGETLLHRWDQLDESVRLELLKRMTQSAGQLDQLLGDLIDVSRLERGAIAALEPLDLGVEVARVLGRLGSMLERHNLEVDIPHRTIVLAEPRSCGQVLANLIGNASKFSPDGSTVTVRAEVRSSEVVISVSDQGVGIEPSELARIFDRFYRVPSAASPPGSGMGLTIAKESVEAMGGRVWAESEPGKGSTFRFTLRRAVTAEPPPAQQVPTQSGR